MGSVEQNRGEYAGLQQQITGYCEETEDLEQGELEFNRLYGRLVRSTRQHTAAALAGSRIRVAARGHMELHTAAIALHPVCALVIAAALGWLVVGGLTTDKAGKR